MRRSHQSKCTGFISQLTEFDVPHSSSVYQIHKTTSLNGLKIIQLSGTSKFHSPVKRIKKQGAILGIPESGRPQRLNKALGILPDFFNKCIHRIYV